MRSPICKLRAPFATVVSVFPGYDRYMPWWTAAALALFAVVFLATAIVVAVLLAKTLREVARARVAMTGALEDLTAAVTRLEERLARTTERSAEVERAVEALSVSLEKLSVLRGALSDAGRTYRRFRTVVPRK
jgi:uncharacterized membrane protein YoaK (UPF0700 family)